MIREPNVPLLDMVICLSNVVDLVSPMLVDHHKQVAYAACRIGAELGLPIEQKAELGIAGLLHDIGALTLKEKLSLLNFDDDEGPHRHAVLGYFLLKKLDSLSNVATLVRFHHVPWKDGSGSEFKGKQVPLGSHILHLADRVAVLLNKGEEILGQVKTICEKVASRSGEMFKPTLIEAFNSLAKNECFWLDIISPKIGLTLSYELRNETLELDGERLLSLSNIFRQIIDFRSSFTATHSSGVAAVAGELARLVGFSERECRMMRIAGHLHDLGKLAVSAEILEKPAKLTEDEFNVIRSHTFYTYRALEPIAAFDTINTWASFHHERLDGKGYPFHIKGPDLSLGARIVAVADVFTAITEDRPYRQGMTNEGALQVLQQMADSLVLDPNIVLLLSLHFDEINSLRTDAQATSIEEYRQFMKGG